ncbi:MAG: GTPase Era [Rhodospirillales bacterium]|nr:GTPase Era [Rhodospirillales bacterium]MCB9965752.1 GTPase Era [Rhodospirillales bacterium]MCB9979680.1 GTPase Era [Rhodospirillales bacterium]
MNEQKSALITLIGPPNAGKSTLLNTILGEKVSIVSPKVQTTRSRIRGILTEGDTQLVFTDTPGLFDPKKKLEKAIVHAATEGIKDADLMCVIMDVSARPLLQWDKIRKYLPDEGQDRMILILNKIDRIDTKDLLALSKELNDRYHFAATFMISAEKGQGVKDLVSYLKNRAEDSPWFFPADQLSDLPNRLLAAEITREHLFRNLHQELPYHLTVETEDWENFENGDAKISQVIYVARDGHKGIILGKGGETLKRISITARKELEDLLERRVHLKIFIKVKENWMDDPERFTVWGLET